VFVGVLVLVLVLVCVGVDVKVGGICVAVSVGRGGVEVSSGVGSIVVSAEASTTAGEGSDVDPALHPEIIKMTSRQMKMHNFLSEMIDFI
jgi:hypothetical protein